ncbi:MAG: PmoA family protein [Verrucomicrobia bacterium]|nr:PmoA family protein [Verrucomicrobiota bacterium]MBT7066410.1 PmoA family protein [Verrucomicrobiota bacterium]
MVLLAVSSVLATASHAGELAASREDGSLRVTVDGDVFTAYHYEAADRPFFYPLIAPTGDNITRHWPMKDINKDEERDHKHHRSLWYTHGDVNGHDFWTEGRGPKIVQTALKVESRTDKVVIACDNEWRAKNGDIVCTDSRTHTIRTEADSRIIDFEITIKASHGKIVLGDTKEGSMAFRVAPTLRTAGKVAKGSMLNSEGVSGKKAWGKRARWCDYYGPLNGKTVGIAIMDHTANPRHPTTWHARDYGLCCANPFGLSYFEKKPRGAGNMRIKAGESVTFRYRVLVHSGTAEKADIEQQYGRYVGAGATIESKNTGQKDR